MPTSLQVQKPCGKCSTVKPLGEFFKSNTRGGVHGRQSYCKVCTKVATAARQRTDRARNPARILWRTARERAARKGIEFTITEADVQVPTHCPVLGIELNPVGRRQGPADQSPSIDRIDNDRGYLPGNIVVVSWRANRIKSDAALPELKAVVAFYEKALFLAD